MTETPSYSPIETVRLLVSDTGTGDARIFSDGEINAFLTLEASDVKRAAAQALESIASNEALVGKVIKSQDLSTDGPKVAESLRAHAARLREQAATEDEGFFDIVEFTPYTGGPELTEDAW